MKTILLPLIVLLAPDTYIYIGWGVLLVLTAIVGMIIWRTRRRWLRWLLGVPTALLWYVFLWGTYVGFGKLEVVHYEYASRDLPAAFDGYKIVQFGDAHVGTYSGSRRSILQRAVDSINAQNADLVVFIGDLQNKHYTEIEDVKDILCKVKARDGVISVLGNHDYDMYLDTAQMDDYERYQCLAHTIDAEEQLGWTVLMNERRRIRRDTASIVIAGMENDGEGRFPQRGDITETLRGISRNEFVIMLEHDPQAWRCKILPHCHAQLTLSGHTHGGQLSIFGLTPAMFNFKEYYGWYCIDGRSLYVTKGLGGVIPFRFGATGEIVVITLRSEK